MQCEVCLKEEEATASPLLPPLLHKLLGVLVYEQVMSCKGCHQLLQLWDDFSTQARINLTTTHPNAQHQYAYKEVETLADELGKEDDLEADESDNEIRCTVSCADTASAAAMWSELQSKEEAALELQAELELGLPVSQIPQLELISNQHQDFELDMPANQHQNIELDMSTNEHQDIELAMSTNGQEEFGELSNEEEEHGELTNQHEDKHNICLDEIATTYACTHCSRSFLYEKSLQLHIHACHEGGTEDTKLSCPVCHGRLSTQFQMDQHIRLCHSNAEPESREREQKTTPNYRVQSEFVCEVCGEDLDSKLRLNQHMRAQHGPVPYLSKSRCYKCPYCPQTFKSSTGRLLHLKNYHSKAKSIEDSKFEFSCKICGKGFMRKLGLVTHLRFHPENIFAKKRNNNGEGTSSGTLELSETDTSNGSQVEIPISSDKKYKKRDSLYYCNFCMKSEASEILIQNHIKEYHVASSSKSSSPASEVQTSYVELSPEVKKKKVEQSIKYKGKRVEQFTQLGNTFSCNICDKVLSSATGMDYHISRHHVPNNLANNSKQYHKVGPHFGCNICDKVLVTESGILYHIRHTHYKHTILK